MSNNSQVMGNNSKSIQPDGSKKPRPIRILLADDGSEHAQAAVTLLKDLPLPPETHIHALAVVPTLDVSRHTFLETALEKTGKKLKESGLQVATEIKGGVPAATINDFAERHKPDLIVIGAKGLRATLGILLGGVAQQVVEYSPCPVLVVRAPYSGINRVLMVTDGSTHSQCALAYLGADVNETPTVLPVCEARLPLPPNAEITVMHVLPPILSADMVARSWMVGPDMLFPIPTETVNDRELQAREREQGQALLDDSVRSLKAGGITATSELRRGDAATEAIEFIKANNIDLVVCGSRGLSQVSGWLLGSVSRKLVHYSGCSVLIVKGGEEG
ncbi:MAG: universal stress protein [Anaerolineales bacterium]